MRKTCCWKNPSIPVHGSRRYYCRKGVERALQSTGTSRQIVMVTLYQFAGLNYSEIGDLLGVDYPTVSQGRKRLRDKVEKDIKIKAILERITKECQE